MRYNGIKARWLIVSSGDVRENTGLLWDETGKITRVAPNADLAGRTDLMDASGQIVCPGFINTHMHMYSVLVPFGLKVEAEGFIPYLRDFWWPVIEDRLDHDIIRAVTEFACIDLPAGGYTCVNDTLEGPNSLPGCLEAEAQCLDRSGLRAWLTFEATERQSAENGALGLEENAVFVKNHPAGRIQGMLCLHTTFSCSEGFFRRTAEMARTLGCRWQAHLSEDVDEAAYTLKKYGKRPVELYRDWGVLSDQLLLSQCVGVDEGELDLLAEYGAAVSHQSASNALAGHGAAPVAAMLRRGIPVGLGTDGGRSDAFELMRVTTMAHRILARNSGVMSAGDVFDMATVNGARALGRTDLGTLNEGCRADFLVLDMDTPTAVHQENMIAQLVNYGKKEDIHSVVVDGSYVVRGRANLRFDAQAVKENLLRTANTFWKEAP